MASISSATLKQYSTYLRQWWLFCKKYHWDLHAASSSCLLLFFRSLYDKGGTYGTLNCARSALSLIMSLDLDCCSQFKRFFKGIHNIRPIKPRYNSTWDPVLVLDHLRTFYPNDTLSLQRPSFKLNTLLALVTAHIVQTLSLIKTSNIFSNASGHEILISDNIKTSRFSNVKPILSVPFFPSDGTLSVAKTLQAYLDKTQPLRRDNGQRFLSFRRPHKPATSQTLSRWIRSTLSDSGIDTNAFKAHSTRHASTSAANHKGLNIDVIKRTAGWSSKSNTFSQFYNRPVVNRAEFYDDFIMCYT